MKTYTSKIFILLFFLLGFSSLQAQSLMTRKGQYLYVGIENWIDVFPANSAEQYKVSFPGCKVEERNGSYYVSPSESLIGKGVTATITAKDNPKQEPIQQRFFVTEVPSPTAIFGTCFGNSFTIDELFKFPKLRASMNVDFPYDISWKITSYKIVLITDDGLQPAIVCDGSDLLSESTIAHIRNKSDIRLVIFTDIKATSIVGERYLQSIFYRIK